MSKHIWKICHRFRSEDLCLCYFDWHRDNIAALEAAAFWYQIDKEYLQDINQFINPKSWRKRHLLLSDLFTASVCSAATTNELSFIKQFDLRYKFPHPAGCNMYSIPLTVKPHIKVQDEVVCFGGPIGAFIFSEVWGRCLINEGTGAFIVRGN